MDAVILYEDVSNTTDINQTAFSQNMEIFQKHADKFSITFGIFNFVPNLFIIISSGLILKSKVQPKSTHIFLGNLAMGDFVYGIVGLLLLQFKPEIEGDYICTVIIGLAKCYYIECSLSVCFIAVDRYLFIHYGMYYAKWMTTKMARYIVLATWVFSLSISLVIDLISARYEGLKRCSYFATTPRFLSIFIACIGTTLFAITIILYIIIFKTALKVSKKRKENCSIFSTLITIYKSITRIFVINKSAKQTLQKQNMIIKSGNITLENIFILHCTNEINILYANNKSNVTEKRLNQFDNSKTETFQKSFKGSATKNELETRKNILFGKLLMFLLLIISSFLVAWGPSFVCVALHVIVCAKVNEFCFNVEIMLQVLAIYLGLINAFINPLIYFYFYKGFRKALMKLCCKKHVRKNRRKNVLSFVKTSVST